MQQDQTRSSISTLVSDFAAQLEAIVRQAAVDQITSALAGLGASTPARRGPGRPRATATRKPGRPAKRGKRSSEDVDATAQRLVAYVKSNPGQGLEGIAAGLDTSTKELKLPVIKLLASRQIKKTGEKRGTKYFPGGGGAGPGRATKKATKKKGRRTAKRPRWAKKAA